MRMEEQVAPRPRSCPWPWLVVAALGLLVFSLFAQTARAAEGSTPGHVRVRGVARIDAHASRSAQKLVLRGTLTDDAGNPLGGRSLDVKVAGQDAAVFRFGVVGASSPEACASRKARPAVTATGDLTVPTLDDGSFCVALDVPIQRYLVHVGWAGSEWLDAAATDLAVDLLLRALTLTFKGPPAALDLDGPAATLEILATAESDGVALAIAGINVTLGDERGMVLASGSTSDAGRARVVVDMARLGPPGAGELRASFEGNAELSRATAVTKVTRRIRAVLKAVDVEPSGQLAAATAEEGFPIRVSVTTARGEPVPHGSVEALFSSSTIGAATVEEGMAVITAAFAATSIAPVPLRVRYVPDSPWYTPGNELALSLPLRSPSPWRKISLVAAGVVVIGWLVLARTTRRRTRSMPSRPPAPPPAVAAKINLVAASPPGSTGWRGSVVDAHDRLPIAGARITVQRGSFGRVMDLGSAVSDAAGRFEIAGAPVRGGDRMVAGAALHSQFDRLAPPSGEIEIALVLRKRALLDRLVAWAKARGKPFDARPEATPAHVRKAAAADVAVARWAGAVERAAFGPGSVDASLEHEIDRLAPLLPGAATLRDSRPPSGVSSEAGSDIGEKGRGGET